jgi:hypothetical protein
MLNAIQERKQIEKYILNDFLPYFFSGFKEKDNNYSKNRHHKTYFEYQGIQYIIEVLTYGDGYGGFLNILNQVGSEIDFSKKGSLEEFFLFANKRMKQYKLSKLYK